MFREKDCHEFYKPLFLFFRTFVTSCSEPFGGFAAVTRMATWCNCMVAVPYLHFMIKKNLWDFKAATHAATWLHVNVSATAQWDGRTDGWL